MSRSYKHHPFCTDRHHGAKWWKNQANRRVRHYKGELPNGKAYKKVYESWEIRDYNWYMSKEAARDWYHRRNTEMRWGKWVIEDDYPTFEDYINKVWAFQYYRK